MPGPLLAVGIAETPRHGWKTGPIISLGHAVAEIGVVVVLSLGLAVLRDNPMLTQGIGVVGGLALILMGATMSYDAIRNRIDYKAGGSQQESAVRLSGKGLMATLVNPYWFIWWATIGLAFLVDSRELGLIGPVTFYFGHIMSDLVWYSLVSFILWRGRSLMVGNKLRVLILICATFLLYLGVTFIINGITGNI
ncbi:MAG: LysE family transporter [candidate division Zixibacteria bacterium]